MSVTASIQVVAGVIRDTRGRVLIQRRDPHAHQGGLWEFPGGKLEPGESVQSALRRELDEELGITVERARPLIRVRHAYPERRVLLDVWCVERYRGAVEPRLGQPLDWVAPEALRAEAFPAADRPVLAALRLPDRYLITPEPAAGRERFLERLERCAASGQRLIQLRAHSLGADALRALAEEALARCRRHGARLLINGPARLALEVGADGVHLGARALRSLATRPLPSVSEGFWVAASCHDARELEQAARVGVDFAVLSPVCATPSHPGTRPLGWDTFAALIERAPFPVYALGGVGPDDIGTAQRCGAQGIAAIRALWSGGG